jgi:hypothetical protein
MRAALERSEKLRSTMPQSGVVERTLPDGSWERTYYGRDIEAARGDLKVAGEKSMEEHARIPMTRLRFKGGREDVVQESRVESFEKRGVLDAFHEVRVSGVAWGGRERGCSVCHEIHGGLRYHLPSGMWLCKRRCFPAQEAMV